ncbi:geranylgeranylglycerol-phosphate geranylgeranyltransferase [Reichenbachiella carrageenanivorans]|uniref:Geranylgeranylglycerol-phosphate geranylgeranyltransferase n=1 Tax=Reichenbachiella carrageenanivorans TaxID=2979869 RepID=A0ABY6D227_9BACT|nr:geranylgeranylglycerol-phosphate geranylgeranyltransferase [Reichenbachiella carrageenanivorans]UXX80217.1 geranylgeranylglycerol-phosphate geranylgeranyltransferase [Reichenbachiella carrageenanivorans]
MQSRSHIQLLVDALRLSRFNNLIIIFITQYAGSIFLLNHNEPAWYVLGDFRFFVLVLSTVIIAAAGYYINDYYDIKIDLINKPSKVIVGHTIKRRPVMIAHTTLNAIGILLGSMVSLWIGFVHLVCAFLLWWYSNQLKRLPFVGNFVVAALTATTLLVLLVYYHSVDLLTMVYALFAFGITLIREIIKDIEDVEGDASYGGLTLPVWLGIRRTKWILFILIIPFVSSLVVFLLRVQNQYLLYYFGLLAVPFLHFLYRFAYADTKKHFSYLSRYCKWLIIAGIFSMAILKL